MSDQNKAIVRRYLEAFANNDQTTLMELLAPDHTFHYTSVSVDRETHLQGINAFSAAFSDLHFTVEDQIAERDTVATRLTWRAKHSGDFQGHPATHKAVEVSAMSIERIDEGKIVERWFIHNELELLQQFGVVPAS